VLPDAQGGFLYQIAGSAVTAKDEGEIRDQLLGIIEPIAGGGVTITRYEAVRNVNGRILTYNVWVRR
jgi:hypothetical protein